VLRTGRRSIADCRNRDGRRACENDWITPHQYLPFDLFQPAEAHLEDAPPNPAASALSLRLGAHGSADLDASGTILSQTSQQKRERYHFNGHFGPSTSRAYIKPLFLKRYYFVFSLF